MRNIKRPKGVLISDDESLELIERFSRAKSEKFSQAARRLLQLGYEAFQHQITTAVRNRT